MASISSIKLPNGTSYTLKDSVSGYTTNTGTVTSVAVSGGTGISISGSPITTSGTITITNSGVTGVKGSAESSYRTGSVSITSDNVNAITKNLSGNTQNLRRPLTLQGVNDVTIDSKINTLRANRLAFLPADQIIIEKTTDGGTTWVDAEIADATKIGLFSETRPSVTIPLLNGKKSPLCGLRFTITAMKYDVPAGTAETAKYSYWNKDYIKSTERYNQLKEMYFWVSTSGGYINVKVERATGANPTNWSVISNDTSFNMTGYSGNDYISFSQNVFGGGTTQVNNYWNYRITFMTDDYIPNSPYDSYSQSIMEIRGYGDTWWTKGNEYAANDKIYEHDYLKNVVFPAKVTATTFIGALTGTASGNLTSSSTLNAAKLSGTVPAASLGNVKVSSSGSGNAITSLSASNGTITYTLGATYAASNHTHGNITSGGDITATAPTIANGDQIIINDSSASKITNGPTFDGSTTTKALSQKGTWESFAKAADIPSSMSGTTASSSTGITASTTATKTTLGTAFSIPNVTSVGSASTWAFTGVTVANSISGTIDSSDNTQLNITLGTTTVNSKSSGSNGSAPTLGTAFSVPNVTGNTSASVSITDNGHTHTVTVD